MKGLVILVKALLSGEATPDHLFTDFPGRVTEGSSPGCMAYNLAFDLGGLTNWSV